MNFSHVPIDALLGQKLLAQRAAQLLGFQSLALAGGLMPDVQVPSALVAVGTTNLMIEESSLPLVSDATTVALVLKFR